MTRTRPLSAVLGLSLGLALAVTGTAAAVTTPPTPIATAAAMKPGKADARWKSARTDQIGRLARNLKAGERAAPAAPAPARRTSAIAPKPAATPHSPSGDNAPRRAAAATTTTTAAGCSQVAVSLTETNDKVWVSWSTDPQAATKPTGFQVYRQRDGGSWQSLGRPGPNTTRLRDLTTNPDGIYTYRVWAFYANAASNTSCDVADSSMQTIDGRGYSDAVVATDLGLYQGNDYSLAAPLNSGVTTTPSFSPDGRLVAYAWTTGTGTWQLRVAQVRTGAVVASTSVPTDQYIAYPSWSPDGQRIVVTSYSTVDDSAVGMSQLDLGNVGAGFTDAGTPAGYMQGVWLDNTTLVMAQDVPGAGLFTMKAGSAGTPTAFADTKYAGFPEVGPDGTVYYTASDSTGATYEVDKVLPGGASATNVVPPTGSAYFLDPRVSPDGRTLYYESVDAAQNTFEIIRTPLTSGGLSGPTPLGVTLDEDTSGPGFNGYDVRQPASKGTSDFVGDANNDVIAKGSNGVMYAYPNDQAGLITGRVSLGAGWNIYNQVVAAGDLNGDDEADILGRDPNGGLWMYAGHGQGRLSSRVQVGSGWSSYVLLAGGDYTGDDKADLLGRDAKGALWVYPGDGAGHFGARRLITSGWGGFSAIIAFGDFNYDNASDILGRDRSGTMYLYPGNGTGGITGRVSVGGGWNNLNAFAGPEFVGYTTGLFGRWSNGAMAYYESIGDGRFDSKHVWQAGGGWSTFQFSS